MFDSNAGYFEIGVYFFSEVSRSNPFLEQYGIKEGDIVLCCHLSESETNPRFNKKTSICFDLKKEPIIYETYFNSDDLSLLIFSGLPDGSGFIDLQFKQKAKKFLQNR